MDLIPYHLLFQEQARNEIRSLTIRGRFNVPDDSYGLLEFYCADPDCDCQSVFLEVLSQKHSKPLGTVMYAFHPEGEDADLVFEALTRHTFTPAVLQMVADHLESDLDYIKRLQGHYRQVKQAVSDPLHPSYAIYQSWKNNLPPQQPEPKTQHQPKRAKAGEKKTSPVPKVMQDRYEEIASLTDRFCHEHLSDEYAQTCRKMAAALSRKRPSPLTGGKALTWAAGIVYAVGQINFLFDKSQNPHMRADEIGPKFGISPSTASNKARQIHDLLKTGQFSPEYCLPSLIDENPMVWMISVNGFLMDARHAPREIQEEAFLKGLIPYIPDDRK